MNTAPAATATPRKVQAGARVLVVDDETPLLRANARMLEEAGYVVTQAADGIEAGVALQGPRFDAIISDIRMPGMSGIQLLRRIRELDVDVPVLLLTGNPGVESAVQALEFGALRYLIKPLSRADLVKNVEEAVALGRIARIRRDSVPVKDNEDSLYVDRAAMTAGFDNAMATLWMAYQPIVNWKTREVAAYEALVRNNETRLMNPVSLLAVAEKLGRVCELGRVIRYTVAQRLREVQCTTDIFVNLHPADLMDESLYADDAPLAPMAKQIVLEITERQALDATADIPARVARLRKTGYRLAIDDLGSGYSSLTYFANLTPEVAKIDMALVRDIDSDVVKQALVGSLVALCRELGLQVVAEGIETAAERNVIAEMGCDLFQGYLFARPAREFPAVKW